MHIIRKLVCVWLACIFSAGAVSAEQNAKDVFFDQMQQPAQKINNGISYWIELRRQGKISKVDNRTLFKSGDRIRFHFKANIDGYASIVLLRGTSGASKVLYPLPGAAQGSRVTHGREYNLPAPAWLVFDSHSGQETVRLALSRIPLDSRALLKKPDKPFVQIAASDTQAELPANYLLDIASAAPSANSSGAVQAQTPPPESAQPSSDDERGMSKDLFVQWPGPAAAHHKPALPVTVAHKKPGKHVSSKKPADKPAPPPAVTIVNTSPTEPLFADIVLNHK